MASWIDQFKGLARLPEELRGRLVSDSRVVRVPKGTVIFGPGKAPENLLLLLDGVVRVQQVSETGREIILYRVHALESCVLTTACLLAYEDYQAEGVAETDVQAVAIPKAVFEEMMAGSSDFRRFVFQAYSRRITDLFTVIEEVAFKRVDLRLAKKLSEMTGAAATVKKTHGELASELGTAREVVSRQLQEFQRRGWIALHRGSIEVTDRDGLEAFSRL
ncbi:MAG: Crp/Fnr family transcriptional regulator [Alphaproteobacteria bacterium]|nr:Crp/Fnr family transcriptional regulator [Alphaproteobacteria bacterium]